MAIELHVGLHPDRPIDEVADLAAAAEAAGFDGVWIADSQSIFRDAYAALTLAADRTCRVALGVGVTNPVTRHAVVIAGAMASVDELSGGRLTIGIGTGETAVESLGRRRARLAEMDAAIGSIRGLLAGEAVEIDGAEVEIAWPTRAVPVVMAATGPRSLRLAGRAADGAYLKIGAHPDLIAYALDELAAGAAEGGADPAGLRVQMLLPVAVSEGDGGGGARDEVRGFAAAIARAAKLAVPPGAIPADLLAEIENLERVSSAARGTQSYVDWLHSPKYLAQISDPVVDAFAIAGTPAEVADRLRVLGKSGVDAVVAPLTMTDPAPHIEAIGGAVVPRLADS